MKKHVIIRFLIFFILFAGAIEAKPAQKDEKDNAITIFGAFNTFTVSSCSTTDRYIQGSAGAKYDRKLDENVSMHVSGTYSRSKKISRKFEPDEEGDKPDDIERIYNSGMGSVGVSFGTEYFRMRTDFMLSVRKEYFNEKPDQLEFMPMGGILLEAGKMDMIWISTGSYHPEYPFGSLQGALNGRIGPIELGGGAVWNPTNLTTWKNHDDSNFSVFLRTRTKISNTFALRAFFNVKPMVKPEMMFEGSLGMEFLF